MKRHILACAMCLCGSILRAYADNIPFVEDGKTWKSLYFPQQHASYQGFSNDERLYWEFYKPEPMMMHIGLKNDTLIDGHSYQILSSMFSARIDLPLREQDGIVYCYDETSKSEEVYYDFHFASGDMINHQYGFGLPDIYRYSECIVNSVDTLLLNGNACKRIHFDAYPENIPDYTDENIWIEGIGNVSQLNYPLFNIVNGARTGTTIYTVYAISPSYYLSLPFTDIHLRGQQLRADGEVGQFGDEADHLSYSFEGDTLCVEGYMLMNDGPNQYIYCADDVQRLITFSVDELEPVAPTRSHHRVSLRFAGFREGDYVVIDRSGEHPVSRPSADGIAITKRPTDTAAARYNLKGQPAGPAQRGIIIDNRGHKRIRK